MKHTLRGKLIDEPVHGRPFAEKSLEFMKEFYNWMPDRFHKFYNALQKIDAKRFEEDKDIYRRYAAETKEENMTMS